MSEMLELVVKRANQSGGLSSKFFDLPRFCLYFCVYHIGPSTIPVSELEGSTVGWTKSTHGNRRSREPLRAAPKTFLA